MMVFSEKWGKDIETAKKLALQELKVSEDDVKVTVLEEPSKGFLGIGSKLALVKNLTMTVKSIRRSVQKMR